MFPWLRVSQAGAVAVLMAACAAAPVQTMSDARQTIHAAEVAGAAASAPVPLAAARDGLKRAEDLIRAHDYRGASREATEARAHAADALALAQSAQTPR
jgi:hypothetical protein